MDYEKLKEVIAKQIKENGKREITGPVLQAVLMAMVDSLGEVYPQTYTDEEKAQARANIDALSNYDGEIAKEKLSLEVQAILNDVANKQNISDATLATIAKTIFGAINEVYKGGLEDASIATSKIKDGAITEPKLDTDLINVITSAVQPAELASAIATALASYVAKADIVATTGSATDKVMSQHGVTEAIDGVTNKVTELDKQVNGGVDVEIMTTRLLNEGFIDNKTGLIRNPTSTWKHSDIIPIDDFVKAGNFTNNLSVAPVAFYSENRIASDTYVGYFAVNTNHSIDKTIVLSEAAQYNNANFVVVTSDDAGEGGICIVEYKKRTDVTGLKERVESNSDNIGDLSILETIQKTNLVVAINETKGEIDGVRNEIVESFDVGATLDGYINRSGVITSPTGTWKHTDIYPISQFDGAGVFVAHGSVSNIAFYSSNVISASTFLGFISKTGNLTREEFLASVPQGANFFVASNNEGSTSLSVHLVKKNIPEMQENIELLQEDVHVLQNKSAVISPRMLHISWDDTIGSLYDLYTNNRQSIFDSPFFGALKSMHDTYGCVFSCYCFLHYLDTDEATTLYSLRDVPNTWASEFESNSDWLRFGFHSVNNYTTYGAGQEAQAASDYAEFISQIIRITGSPKSIDLVIRTQSFSGTLSTCRSMRDADCGVLGFLTADYDETGGRTGGQSRGYYLTSPAPVVLWNKGHWYDSQERLHFYPSSLRIDATAGANMPTYMAKFLTANKWGMTGMIIMYGHENQMFNYAAGTISSDYVTRLTAIAVWAKANGFTFGFPMDRIRSSY